MRFRTLLNHYIFTNPVDEFRPDGEKLVLILFNEHCSSLSGKAKHREVPEPVSKWSKVEHLLLVEISSTCDPAYLNLLHSALSYVRDLCAESTYSGSFAAKTESKHTVENGGRKFRNWGEHIQFTPRTEQMRREIPKKTPNRHEPSMDNEMRSILGLPEVIRGNPIRRKEAADPIAWQPYDSLSDTRPILPPKSKFDDR